MKSNQIVENYEETQGKNYAENFGKSAENALENFGKVSEE